MDELVQHCLHELSFDGDFGCSASRLQSFIRNYYTRSDTPQNVDEAYCSFVWSLIVQKPNVLVGLLPAGATADIAIAPQPSKIKGKQKEGTEPSLVIAALDVLPDGKTRSLRELTSEHGDSLRIATNAETTFAAITGSHTRPSSLTAMVYTVLQLVTRGREQGVSTIVIGKTTGYDQKTVHYLVNKLISLDYVYVWLKLRQPGSGMYFCVHKYFYQRSEHWKDVREEENKVDMKSKAKDSNLNDVDADVQNIPSARESLAPLDARHLSSLTIVRSRLVKLLEGCTNHLHAAQNIIKTLGFRNPTKSDRRLFATRLRSLILEGLIEAVDVRRSSKGKNEGCWVKCIRLVSSDVRTAPVDEEEEVKAADDIADDDLSDASVEEEEQVVGMTVSKTLQAQMVDLLERAGRTGMILSEIEEQLSGFDKRTIELQLTRLELATLPAHIANRAIANGLENHGRERRQRFWIRSAYVELFPQDGTYPAHDTSRAGEFAEVDPALFWSDEATLYAHVDSLRSASGLADASLVPVKKKTPKKKKYVNPILPDGTVKKGRPRKNPDAPVRIRGIKRKRLEENGQAPPAKKQRGGKPKAQVDGNTNVVEGEDVTVDKAPDPIDDALATPVDTSLAISEPVSKKRRGPSKKTAAESTSADKDVSPDEGPPAKRRRGRPPKAVVFVDPISTQQEVSSDPQPPFSRRDEDGLPLAPSSEHTVDFPQDLAAPATATVHHTTSSSTPQDIEMRLVRIDDPSTYPTDEISSVAPVSLSLDQQPAMSPPPSQEIDTPVPSSTKKAKKAKGSSRTNLSAVRREQEFFQLLQDAGGIRSTNVQEFQDAHQELLVKLTAEKQPTSGPVGVQADKRTVDATFIKLETKGMVKLLKTAVKTTLGTQRPITIAYVPDLPSEALQAFLANVSRNPWQVQAPVRKKITDCIVYGTDSGHVRPAMPLQLLQLTDPGDKDERWSKNADRADQLFSHEDHVIHDVLLSEFTTQAQFYGFIVPKAIRARQLHAYSLAAFEGDAAPAVVSREHHILKLSYYHEDMSVAEYCSIVSVLINSSELAEILCDENRRRKPLRDLPYDLYEAIQANRARARSRVLDVLETLRCLNLVVPLRPSESPRAWINCAANGDHPTAFDRAPLTGWSYCTPSEAPVFWRFNTLAPLHLWSLSSETPSFWKDVSIKTEPEVIEYWSTLKELCLSQEQARTVHCPITGSATGPLQPTPHGAACLPRKASWKEEYILTWHQERFIRLMVLDSSWNTQDEEAREEKMQRACYITSAPRPVVEHFVAHVQATYEREKHKAEERERKRKEPAERAKRKAETKQKKAEAKKIRTARAVIQQRSEQARAHRLQDWDHLVLRVHPDPLSPALAARLRRLQDKFLASMSTRLEIWEETLTQEIRDSQMVMGSRNVEPSEDVVVRTEPPRAVSVALPAPSAPQRPVQAIIDEMGPSINEPKKKKKKKRIGRRPKNYVPSEDEDAKDDSAPQEKSRTRRRWAWTTEHEDLARDACAVIRARCKGLKERLDWGALETVFPAIPRNSVRQRLARWNEDPQQAAYMARLEASWSELWLQYRGTELLPDPNPYSISDWPVVAHIEFLRKHIDKGALRAGYVQTEETVVVDLPVNIATLRQLYTIVERRPVVPVFDFITEATVDEGREKVFQTAAFDPGLEDVTRTAFVSDAQATAESALKMVFGTPKSAYDADQASAVLRSLGDGLVSEARRRLLAQGVLSKLVRDDRTAPGRTLKISEANQNSLEGSIEEEIFSDAVAFDESFAPGATGLEVASGEASWDEVAWDVSSGEMAALLELFSLNEVEFRVDVSDPQKHREAIDWNSKKADDDQIETRVFYRARRQASGLSKSTATASSPSPPAEGMDTEPFEPDLAEHGVRMDGEPASCGIESGGIIDCRACVADSTRRVLDSLMDDGKAAMVNLVRSVEAAGAAGVPESDMQAPHRYIGVLLERADEIDAPPFIRVGYSRPLLVSVNNALNWTVSVSNMPRTRILPRRWLDIWGGQISSVKASAIRSVLGLVTLRPGTTQEDIARRLQLTFDWSEVNEIVRSLVDQRKIVIRYSSGRNGVGAASAGTPFLFVAGDRRWYSR